MSNSPNKFVGAAARVASGGRANTGGTGTRASISEMAGIFGAFKQNRRLEKAKRAQALADYKKRAAMSGRQRMRAQSIQAAGAAVGPADELSSAIPDVEANNAIDNTVAAAQDRSQMRDTGELTGVAAPSGFSTMSSDVLNTPPPIAPVQPQTPTYGVAGAAETMFGTPMQRQVSMGSSLMKRACKYKK